MVNKSLLTRLATVEQHRGIGAPQSPTLFISRTEGRWPAGHPGADPDDTRPYVEYSDATTIGLKSGGQGGPVVLRLPGESVKALEARASSLKPDCRVFFTMYADDPRTSEGWLNGAATL
ncbi:hypothetical protein [Variovorax guangxiensis]|uniref:hypothetical protein n=1 Tax=Variovorax guangxiensis TaxID=1775474 RepID=UPI00285D0612|nr:hypothetical protein [Variovorax guangxiensis]MDR6857237.1 hypothetical protein [Variovorax guangxiensis]